MQAVNDTAQKPLFTRPDGRPLPKGHHLDRHRGKFRVKATIDQGDKFSGKRICIPLRTEDPERAEYGRDVAIYVLSLVGFLCREIVVNDEPEESAAGDEIYSGDSPDGA